MAEREKQKVLEELREKNIPVYSISRLNTIDQCLYQAYNTYVLNNRGLNNVYGVLGSKVHEVLEEIINDNAERDNLYRALHAELDDLEMLSMSFPKDVNGNDTIRENWVADMTHFCKNFEKPTGKFTTEEFVLYKTPRGHYVQGYIDLIRHNDDGTISILDWKTSSKFSKADLLHHGRQLIFYALAKESEGYVVRDVAWYMMKYVEVSFMGKKRVNSKNETMITKVINRGKIVKELKDRIEVDLSNLGYDDIEIEVLLDESLKSNSLSNLPKEIIDKYKISPYIENYSLTDELKQECLGYIDGQADLFESLDPKCPEDFPPRKFTKINTKGIEVEDIFFCKSLCSFRTECKYIEKYKAEKLSEPEEDWEKDLFYEE